MLTIGQVRNDLLSKLGIEDFTLAPALALQDCLIAINFGMQMLQTAGQDYFTRQVITFPIFAGTALYPISQAVQAILGPIRLNGAPLKALQSRGEMDQFDRIFLGSSDFGVSAGDPFAYWIQTLNSSAAGDNTQINIYLAPVPNAGGTLELEVVDDAPSFTLTDMAAGTAVLPVAQDYCESILLPISRKAVTRSSQFSRPDILQQLTEDADVAMQRLGLAGGFPNVQQDEPPRKISG